MPEYHSNFGGSVIERRTMCTKSYEMELHLPKTVSAYAEQGTYVHSLGEYKLNEKYGVKGRDRPTHPEYDSPESEENSDIYVNYVSECHKIAADTGVQPIVLIEQRVNYSGIFENPECESAFGTADCLILSRDLDVIDYKNGFNFVVAENNFQLRMYAIGCLQAYDCIFDFEKIRLHIVQPRAFNICMWEITIEELIAWRDDFIKVRVSEVLSGNGTFTTGDHCKYCKAMATCKFHADWLLALAEFESEPPDHLTDEEIDEALLRIQKLMEWEKALKVYVLNQMVNNGKTYPSFKLVKGRSQRKISDENAAINALRDAGFTDVFEEKLLGIVKLENKLGKEVFHSLLGGFLVKGEGKMTLARIEDKRAAIDVEPIINDFKEE